MGALTVTKKVADLKVLFNKIKEVYFTSTPSLELSKLTSVDMELPVLSDGISFDTGAPSVTAVKLTTGETWTSIAEAGDASIEFQISSIAGDINNTFLNKQAEEETVGAEIEGNSYKGAGFDLEPKKVTGGLFMLAEDRQTAVFLPNVEIYASFVIDQSKTGYFNLAVTPTAASNGVTIYLLEKTEAGE